MQKDTHLARFAGRAAIPLALLAQKGGRQLRSWLRTPRAGFRRLLGVAPVRKASGQPDNAACHLVAEENLPGKATRFPGQPSGGA